jgi:hypothetical protein
MVNMQSENLLSIGCAAVEAGVSVARMRQALLDVGAAAIVELNHVPHYDVADVERAVEHVHQRPVAVGDKHDGS